MFLDYCADHLKDKGLIDLKKDNIMSALKYYIHQTYGPDKPKRAEEMMACIHAAYIGSEEYGKIMENWFETWPDMSCPPLFKEMLSDFPPLKKPDSSPTLLCCVTRMEPESPRTQNEMHNNNAQTFVGAYSESIQSPMSVNSTSSLITSSDSMLVDGQSPYNSAHSYTPSYQQSPGVSSTSPATPNAQYDNRTSSKVRAYGHVEYRASSPSYVMSDTETVLPSDTESVSHNVDSVSSGYSTMSASPDMGADQ